MTNLSMLVVYNKISREKRRGFVWKELCPEGALSKGVMSEEVLYGGSRGGYVMDSRFTYTSVRNMLRKVT